MHHQNGQGKPHDLAAPDDGGFLPFQADIVELQNLEHTGGRAGLERTLLERQFSKVFRVKDIGVFLGGYPAQHFFFVQTFGKRQLNQHPVHLVIAVQRFDEGDDIILARVLGQMVIESLDTESLGGTSLDADIHLRGRVLAHENDGEPRRPAHTWKEGINGGFQLLHHFIRHRFAFKEQGF